jgi:hypothetical protein
VSPLDMHSTLPSGVMVSVPRVTPQALGRTSPILPLLLE